jgi:hypothetical protein
MRGGPFRHVGVPERRLGALTLFVGSLGVQTQIDADSASGLLPLTAHRSGGGAHHAYLKTDYGAP